MKKTSFVGASLAGLAATAYFFLGPKAKQRQNHAKAWAIKMKGDVVEKLEKATGISEPAYHEIIDSVSNKYEKGMKASHEEIAELGTDLKKHWKTISSLANAVKNEVVVAPKKIVKKIIAIPQKPLLKKIVITPKKVLLKKTTKPLKSISKKGK